MLSYENLKKILFLFQPETAHNIAEFGLHLLPKIKPLNKYMIEKNFIEDEKLVQEILGIRFANPVGLAAGFDKNATMIESMQALGFGFTEIGRASCRERVYAPV